MAFDKLVDSAKLDGALKATANAIKPKIGKSESDLIPWDSDTGFSSFVESITVGDGSGSGGGIEWESVMPATDISFVDGEYIADVNVYPLILGATYKVKWGDEEYTSVAERTTFQEMDCIAIGNLDFLNGRFPDENPFIIGYIPSANRFGIMRIDTSGYGAIIREDVTLSVAIEKAISFGAVIQPLEITQNGIYTALNGVDGYSPITVNVDASGGAGGVNIDGLTTTMILSERTISTTYQSDFECYQGQANFTLEQGKCYMVTFDGVQYLAGCTKWSRKVGGNSGYNIGVGQSRIQAGICTNHEQPASDVPFFLMSGYLMTSKTTGTHTLKVEEVTINLA